jgi:carbonic anhydrase
MTVGAEEAIQRLREGNRRFVEGSRSLDASSAARRAALAGGQEPFAIVLGCSDSRVPAEIVFDQGLGDLFVVRVAGNVVAPSGIASVEFAATRFGTRLVVVLGHAQCGAVAATLEEIRHPEGASGLSSIVDRIRPAIEDVARTAGEGSMLSEAVRANIRSSVARLRSGSPVIEGLVRDEGLVVLGAEYSLEDGVVGFLDEP